MIVGPAAFGELHQQKRVSVPPPAGGGVRCGDVVRAQPAAFKKGITVTVVAELDDGDGGILLRLAPGDLRDIPRLLAAASDALYTRPPLDDTDRPAAAMWGEPGGEPEAVPESEQERVAKVAIDARDKRLAAEEALATIEAEIARLGGLGIVKSGRMHSLKEKAWKARQDVEAYTEGRAA